MDEFKPVLFAVRQPQPSTYLAVDLGPGPHLLLDDHLLEASGVDVIAVRRLVAAVADERPPEVFEDGRQMRDFVHVSDVARANALAVEAVATRSPGAQRAFNVCSGEPVSILDVARYVCEDGGGEPRVSGRFRPGDRLVENDLAEMLGEEGYDVVGQAGDGERAIELAEELRPDLVVLDVKMPKLDGISAAQRIAEQRIAPVVILTAFSQRDLVERARDAGAMAYLVKPFNKNDLVPAIEMAVSRFAELQLLEAEVADLTERLETRKLVDRAKGVLQQQLDLSEPESFRWIQKTAMDLRLSMRQVAEGVIAHGPGIAGGTSQ